MGGVNLNTGVVVPAAVVAAGDGGTGACSAPSNLRALGATWPAGAETAKGCEGAAGVLVKRGAGYARGAVRYTR